MPSVYNHDLNHVISKQGETRGQIARERENNYPVEGQLTRHGGRE